MRLADADHPYYANEGCYYANDCHEEVDSWEEFGWKDSDPDLNLLYRWDWWVPDQDDVRLAAEDDEDPSWCVPTLKLYFILQRKARPMSVFVRNVTEGDESEIRAWLAERAKTMAAIWDPISLAPVSSEVES